MTEPDFLFCLTTKHLLYIQVNPLIKNSFISLKMKSYFRRFISSRFMSSTNITSALSSDGIPCTNIYNELKVGPMKRLYQYYTADAINLAGGVPMDSCFPTKSIDVTLGDGSVINASLGSNLHLNYMRGDGTPALKDWIKSHVASLHSIPAESSHNTCMTVGSTDAFVKILMLIDTDVVMLEEFAYGAAVNVCKTLDKKPIGIPIDENGIVPDKLRDQILFLRDQGIKANVLYMVNVLFHFSPLYLHF